MSHLEAIRWRVRCYVCKRDFSWEGQYVAQLPPSQHKTCKTRSNRKRAMGILTPKPCPHPEKKRFSDQREATVFINDNHPGELMAPYRCRCGEIHIGHLVAVCEAKKINGVWIVSSEEKVQSKMKKRVEKKRHAKLPVVA